MGDRVQPGQPLIAIADEDARRVVGQRRFEVERAGTTVSQLDTVQLLDRSNNASLVPAAEANARLAMAQRAAESVPNRQAKDSQERAQAAYDQSLARQRRVAALADYGVLARQEVEDAQIAASATLSAAQARQPRCRPNC